MKKKPFSFLDNYWIVTIVVSSAKSSGNHGNISSSTSFEQSPELRRMIDVSSWNRRGTVWNAALTVVLKSNNEHEELRNQNKKRIQKWLAQTSKEGFILLQMTGLTCEKFEWKLRRNNHHHRQSDSNIGHSLCYHPKQFNYDFHLNLPKLFRHKIKWFTKWKTVELNGCWNCIGAHVFPVDPVANF